ncbi:MAG: hypothetical protein OXK80_03235 [Bdellovibrionales bacterium]|nr:hypothetical protein [Bdellovibrionales bacterium]
MKNLRSLLLMMIYIFLWNGISTSFAETNEQQEITASISKEELNRIKEIAIELDNKGWIFHIYKGLFISSNMENNLQRTIPTETAEDEEWLKNVVAELVDMDWTFYIQKFYVSATNIKDEDLRVQFARIVQSQYNYN